MSVTAGTRQNAFLTRNVAVCNFISALCVFSFSFLKKRLSDLSNQSHDSQASNSTLSATSHEDRHSVTAPLQREELVDGQSPPEEEDLDEMEVEYIEVHI